MPRNSQLARPKWRLAEPDPRPGHYFVTAVDGAKVAVLAGPYTYHRDALDKRAAAEYLCHERFERQAAFCAYGTIHYLGANPPTALFGVL